MSGAIRITNSGFPTWLTSDEWQRIDQIRELVKQEGDWRCEAAFDDLHVEIRGLRATVAAHEQKHRDDHREIARLTRERDGGGI